MRLAKVGVNWGGGPPENEAVAARLEGEHQHHLTWVLGQDFQGADYWGIWCWWPPKTFLAPDNKRKNPSRWTISLSDPGCWGVKSLLLALKAQQVSVLCKFGEFFITIVPQHITTGENGHVTEYRTRECDITGPGIEHFVMCRYIAKTSLLSHSCHVRKISYQ